MSVNQWVPGIKLVLLEYCFSVIDFDMGLFQCSNNKCKSIEHIHNIDNVCLWLINCCLQAGLETIPLLRTYIKTIHGWSVNGKHMREQSLFCHWIWSQYGKLYTGAVYKICWRLIFWIVDIFKETLKVYILTTKSKWYQIFLTLKKVIQYLSLYASVPNLLMISG